MIRVAQPEDIGSIVAIYNQAIEAGFQTAFTEPWDAGAKLSWLEEHTPDQYPLFVYELDGKVAGWLSVSGYRPGRNALRYAAEVSYFVDKHHRKKGIGSQLLAHGLAACRRLGYKTLIAIIMEPNTASAYLLQQHGFDQWALLPDIADFYGTACSQVYYGIKLN